MTDCKRVRQHLIFYLDGELEPGTLAEIADHLDECPDCFGQAEAELRFTRTLRERVPRHPVPGDLETRVRRMIQLEAPSPVAAAAAARWRPGLRVMVLAVTVLAAGLAGLSIVRPGSFLRAIAGAPAASFDGELAGTAACFGCDSEDGRGPVPHVHRNGLRTASGEFWTILEDAGTRTFVNDGRLRGHRVRVRGTFFRNTRTVSVASLQTF